MIYRDSCDVGLAYNLSFACLDDSEYCEKRPYLGEGCVCYPFQKEIISLTAGVLCVVNAVIGLPGNLLTVLAIPYAKAHCRFGFRKDWDSTTLFIVNLALSDLLYCTVNLPMYAVQYLQQQWPWGRAACVAFATVRYVNAIADWMFLAFIALSRCLGTVSPKVADRFLAGRRGWGMIAGIWLYVIVLVSGVVYKQSGIFGYNCRNGKCDLMQMEGTADSHIDPRCLLFGIGFSIPCIIIFISYMVIWIKVRSSTQQLRQIGLTDQTDDQLQCRDLRMTWTLLFLCLSYLVFVTPITVVNIVDPTFVYADLHLVLHCVYWFQYSLNFVVYALRSEQYRKAYLDFLHRMWLRIKNCCCCCASNTTIYVTSRGDSVVRESMSMSNRKRRFYHHRRHRENSVTSGSSIPLMAMVTTTTINVSIHNDSSFHSFNIYVGGKQSLGMKRSCTV